MNQNLKRRLLAGVLSACMIFETVGMAPVYAAENTADSVCENHKEHDEACGYVEGKKGTPCTHEHTEDCYKEVELCLHEHTGECYADAEDREATGSNAEDATECGHICDWENGCITKQPDCQHEHDEACGYAEAGKGSPCTHTCELCAKDGEEATEPATDSDVQKGECLCDPVISGEGVHTNEECPYYVRSDIEQTSVEKLIAIIDALPDADEITDENRETAKADLEAVFAEYDKLFEDETITDLDGQLGAERMEKLTALREVLLDMVNLVGEVYGLLKDDTGTVYATNSDGTQTDGTPIDKTTVTHLFVGSGVTEIDINAFMGCTNLTTIDLSKATALQRIGSQAFAQTGITSITIPASVTEINGFKDCTSLRTVDLSDATALTTIGSGAFLRCTNLTTIDLSKATALQAIAAQAFAGTGITSIMIPISVTGINASAFDTCTSLTEVNLPNAKNLSIIGNKAFFGCTNLTTVDLSSATALQIIGDQAFQGTGITSITIPESVTKIGVNAFNGTGITSITIPASVTDIGGWTFGNCTNLNTVTFKGATPPTTIGATIFVYCDALEKIYVPNGSKSDYANATNLKAYADIMVGYKLETEFAGGVKTDKAEYTYGDTITVTVTPTATDTIVPQTFELTPPSAEEIALFVGETQITEPKAAPIDTELTFTVNTKGAALKNGKNTITAKYVGGVNSIDYVGTVTVTLNGKPIDFTSGDHSTATLEDNGYTWTGDAANGYTLTLGNLTLTASNESAITLPDADVEIVLAGKTTIGADLAGIFCDGTASTHTVTISGDGSLSATSVDNFGIRVVQNLSITGGTLDMKGRIGGIYSNGDIEITGGRITGNTIQSYNGALTISGGTVDVSSTGFEGITAYTGIEISGGTVNATSTEEGGISSMGDVKISGGSITAKGGKTAIWGMTDITLSPGMSITNPAGATVGYFEEGKAILLGGKSVLDVTIGKTPVTPPNNGGSGGGGSSSGTGSAAETSGTVSTDGKKGQINSITGIITGANITAGTPGDGYSHWQQEEKGWKLQYADGTILAGTVITGADGTVTEQPAWELINGAWYAFGADGYAKSGLVFDPVLNGWFYIDINSGMKTGWQFVEGKWRYFNPLSDGTKGKLAVSTKTPDGYDVDQDGVWNG
ncbi:MAG: leucine-rich repeat protein [Lachnospiraceae bacterium]|nr:leucine-rich repeat protein [Lachnospiraceae bacterium]